MSAFRQPVGIASYIGGGYAVAMNPPVRIQRWANSIVYALALFAISVLLLGAPGYPVGMAGSVLLIAWRHDNNAGVFFPLAILVLIMLLVLFGLFYLLAMLHP